MIVFYGRGDDEPFRRVVDVTAELGFDHRVIDQDRLLDHEIVVGAAAGGLDGHLVVSGEKLPLTEIRSVYSRPLQPRPGRHGPHARRFHKIFVEWLDLHPGLVVNRPAAMHSNASKPYQATLIARAGLRVPPTLVTDDPAEVRAFQAAHGRVIFKSISGVRSVVTELDDHTARHLDRVRALPTQFQAYVPGTDIRVHVVGLTVHATEITTDAVDYRYSRDAELRPCALPAGLTRRCLGLADSMGLPLCGIDLRRLPGGGHVCFEVNPMPAFTYYEWHTGQPISAALAELLAHPDARWSRSSTT